MKPQILVFGGTTEAREILGSGLPMYYSAATEYGTAITGESSNAVHLTGRMDRECIVSFIKENNITFVIDATHPYAKDASANIREACSEARVKLVRVARAETPAPKETVTVASCKEAAEYLDKTEDIALITVGSKELHEFTAVHDYKTRLYPRVLPVMPSLEECERLGFDPRHIIAMHGPFSEEMNSALLLTTKATVMVTKDGGKSGGTEEKYSAAEKNGVKILLVKRPEDKGITVREAIALAREEIQAPLLSMFPLLRNLEGRKAVIIGGGKIAARRAATLLKCGAELYVISKEFPAEFGSKAVLVQKEFEPSDLDGADLAVAATNSREVNRLTGEEAKRRGIEVSVCDAQEESTFFFPSLITCENISVSVSSAGTSPSDTRKISDRIREALPSWVKELPLMK